MLKKLDFRFLSISVISMLIGFFTITGTTQSIISFAGPLNEMAFCVFAFTIGLISLTCIKNK